MPPTEHFAPSWGFTEPLWPIRYKPLPDELLSSWLVRLAHGHGLKVQTFCNLLFGNRLQVWNRDIDRLAPGWLIGGLIAGTAAKPEQAYATTLRVFEGLLYPKYRESGNLPWLLALKIFHRRREGFGQQFCIGCLRDDATPYFRKVWRVGLVTCCQRHACLLEDRCPHCSEPVSFFRIDIGQLELSDHLTSAHCFHCHQLLSDGQLRAIPPAEATAGDWLTQTVSQVERASIGETVQLSTDDFAVFRNLMRLLLTSRKKVNLSDFVGEHTGQPHLDLPPGKRIAFESLSIETRHDLLIRGAWLMADLNLRLRAAVRARAIRYNHLVRDFHGMPVEFGDVARTVLRRKLPSRTPVPDG